MVIDEDEIASSFFPPFIQLSQILEVGQNIDRVICQTVCSLDTITNTLELKKIWVFIKTFSRFGQISPPNLFQITTL